MDYTNFKKFSDFINKDKESIYSRIQHELEYFNIFYLALDMQVSAGAFIVEDDKINILLHFVSGRTLDRPYSSQQIGIALEVSNEEFNISPRIEVYNFSFTPQALEHINRVTNRYITLMSELRSEALNDGN